LHDHANWSVPERRLKKFFKRQKKYGGWATDDDVTTASTVSSVSASVSFTQKAVDYMRKNLIFSYRSINRSSNNAATVGKGVHILVGGSNANETMTVATHEEEATDNSSGNRLPAVMHEVVISEVEDTQEGGGGGDDGDDDQVVDLDAARSNSEGDKPTLNPSDLPVISVTTTSSDQCHFSAMSPIGEDDVGADIVIKQVDLPSKMLTFGGGAAAAGSEGDGVKDSGKPNIFKPCEGCIIL